MKNAKYTKEVMDLAREAAQEIINTENLGLNKFKFGQEGGYLWVSNNKDSIIDPVEFEVQGQTFFLGLFSIK